MATFTSTLYANMQPKVLHAGNMAVSGSFTQAIASSAGDVYFLAKVPHGATIVSFEEDHTTGATATGVSFGLSRGVAAGGGASLSCFIAAGAISTVNRRSVVGAPITVSVSDLDPIRYVALTASPTSGTQTTSLIVNFTLVYRMDGAGV